MNDNLKLWKAVEKTDPKHTKGAKVGGLKITSIAPQYQILKATEQFGTYGQTWGFKNIEFDYSITNTPVVLDVMDWTTKKSEKINSILGLVGFKAIFFFPNGEFEIANSIKIFTDNKHSKIDDNYAKKVETDALTKALSKLGFNADVFMGRFDDTRYVAEMKAEFSETPKQQPQATPKPQPKKSVKSEAQNKLYKALVELSKMEGDNASQIRHDAKKQYLNNGFEDEIYNFQTKLVNKEIQKIRDIESAKVIVDSTIQNHS